MATTSLWRVKGNIGSVIRYAENEKKTKAAVPDPEETMINVLAYTSRPTATEEQKYVTPLNCSSEHTAEDMVAVKRAFGKEGGTMAYHGYQSFREGEVTPEIAHEIGVKLAMELWGDRYQVLVATHLDKQSHIHNHFVLNTVSFVDGRKFCRTNADYQRMRDASDRLCRVYGLSVLRQSEGRGKSHAEWQAEKDGLPTIRELIRKDIDSIIRSSVTMQQFYRQMEERGYEFKFYGKDGKELLRPSLKPKGSERFFRFDRLGKAYDLEEIQDRILEKYWYEDPVPQKVRRSYEEKREVGLPGEYYSLNGFAKMLYLFLYLLGLIKDHPEVHPERSKTYRKDILKANRYLEQLDLLISHHITNMEELTGFQDSVREKIDEFSGFRTELHALIRDSEILPDRALYCQGEIRKISTDIRHLRKQWRLAEDFRLHVSEMEKKVRDLGGETLRTDAETVDLRPEKSKDDKTVVRKNSR